jgi:hypothetical protein
MLGFEPGQRLERDVNWAREDPNHNGQIEWYNNHHGFLTSHNIAGQQLFVVPTPCTQSCYFKWTG